MEAAISAVIAAARAAAARVFLFISLKWENRNAPGRHVIVRELFYLGGASADWEAVGSAELRCGKAGPYGQMTEARLTRTDPTEPGFSVQCTLTPFLLPRPCGVVPRTSLGMKKSPGVASMPVRQ